jgi:hypothetical protein
MLAAIGRASSFVSSLAADSPAGLVLEIDVGERLAPRSRTMKQAAVSSIDQGGGKPV